MRHLPRAMHSKSFLWNCLIPKYWRSLGYQAGPLRAWGSSLLKQASTIELQLLQNPKLNETHLTNTR